MISAKNALTVLMAATYDSNTRTTLVVGTDIDLTVCRAVKAAKDGKRTVIISRHQISKLKDETLLKMRAGHRILRRMMFVVPASRYDFLKLMSELPTWGDNVPHQLVLDGVLDGLKSPELACAVAVDTVRACAAVLKSSCQLFVSVDRPYYEKHSDSVQLMAGHYFDKFVSIEDFAQS